MTAYYRAIIKTQTWSTETIAIILQGNTWREKKLLLKGYNLYSSSYKTLKRDNISDLVNKPGEEGHEAKNNMKVHCGVQITQDLDGNGFKNLYTLGT